MNNLKNRVQLIGHLGADPEVKTFDDGNKLAKLSIATNDVYTNGRGEKITDTQWHHVIIRGKQADVAGQYLKKGAELMVEGRLTYRKFTGKDGVDRYYTEVKAESFLMLDKKAA